MPKWAKHGEIKMIASLHIHYICGHVAILYCCKQTLSSSDSNSCYLWKKMYFFFQVYLFFSNSPGITGWVCFTCNKTMCSQAMTDTIFLPENTERNSEIWGLKKQPWDAGDGQEGSEETKLLWCCSKGTGQSSILQKPNKQVKPKPHQTEH